MLPMDHHQSPFDYMEQTPVMSFTLKNPNFVDTDNFWVQPHNTEQHEVAQRLDSIQMQPRMNSFEFPVYEQQVDAFNEFSLDPSQKLVFKQNQNTQPVQEELKQNAPQQIDARP